MARQSPKKKRTKSPKKTSKQSPTRKLQQPTWQARRKLLAELFDEAFQDAAICVARDRMLALFQQGPLAVGPVDSRQRLDLAALTEEHVGNMLYQSPDLARWLFAFRQYRQDFLELARQSIPQLRRFSKEELEDFLATTLFPTPAPFRNAAQYLAPTTPVKVLPTGDLVVPSGSRLTNYQAGEIRDFANSQHPGRTGRPPKDQPTPSRVTSKEEEQREAWAALAYQHEQARVPWRETARVVCPHYNLHDPRERDAARKFVKRLQFKGEDMALQKVQAPRAKKLDD
jgi:hypothetical protein